MAALNSTNLPREIHTSKENMKKENPKKKFQNHFSYIMLPVSYPASRLVALACKPSRGKSMRNVVNVINHFGRFIKWVFACNERGIFLRRGNATDAIYSIFFFLQSNLCVRYFVYECMSMLTYEKLEINHSRNNIMSCLYQQHENSSLFLFTSKKKKSFILFIADLHCRCCCY